MSYTNGLDKPTDYFNTILFSGNSSTNNVTGVGFAPDLIWLKPRNQADNHRILDTVRGASYFISSNKTTAEINSTANFSSFDSDGFTLIGSDTGWNATGTNQVAWNWLASNTTASNTNGDITSTVSVNTTAGFSIVSYTGNGTLGATVGHGLGSAPSMVLVKRRNTTGNWWMYHDGLGGADKYIVLNSTSAIGTSTNIWNNTEPTSNVFSLGDNANYPQVNGTSDTFIAYCFAEKKGFSRFGSYVGNGSSDGSYIHLGFKPAYVLTKSSSDGTKHWVCFDNKRANNFNPQNERIMVNLSDASAQSDTRAIDFLSNGFKMRDNGTDSSAANASGSTQIYMAFAENPFVTSTGIPTTAR